MAIDRTHADTILNAVESPSLAARSLVAASWRRSLLQHKLEPLHNRSHLRLTQGELAETRERMGQTLSVATPTLDRLFNALGMAGFCVLLSDAKGCVVEHRHLSNDEDLFNEWGLWAGGLWDEGIEGTNGIGTCIAEQQALTIHRDQHFFARNTVLSCVDAPIYDHEGKLLAVLDVSSCRNNESESFLKLISSAVVDAARRIETDNFRAAFKGSRIIMGDKHGANSSVLLAVDQHDLVIGATRAARKIFKLSDPDFKNPRPTQDILSGQSQQSDLSFAEQAEIKRALARTNGNVTQAAQLLGIGRATFYRRMKRHNLP